MYASGNGHCYFAILVAISLLFVVFSILSRLSNLGKESVQQVSIISQDSESYNYPDLNDGGILELLANLESRVPDDGGDLEIVAWRAIEKHLKSLPTSPSKSLKFLDAGCGQGRLLTKFCSSLFQQCVGIDADPGRLQQTREALNVAQTNIITSKVQLFAEGADTFKSKDRFDFILNSMVIQHVSNKTAHKIVHNLINQLTPSHGMLVVLTTYFPKPTSFYEGRCASFQKNMSFCLTALTAKEFEKLVTHPTKDQQRPVRLWSLEELRAVFHGTDCEVIDTFQFTYVKRSSVTTDQDPVRFEATFGLKIEEFKEAPISQGIVCRKKGQKTNLR